MPLEFITESSKWRITESLYDRVKRHQRRGKTRDNDLMDLLNDLEKYLEWERYVAGRRSHKWDDNERTMIRDRNGYTDTDMVQDFKKFRLDDDHSPIQTGLVADVKTAYEECEVRQFEVDELEIHLQHKLGELEKAHELFRDRMCEIKRQSFRVRSTVRARPVNFPARDNYAAQARSISTDPAQTGTDDASPSATEYPGSFMERAHHQTMETPPQVIRDILELSQEYGKGDKGSSTSLKKRWLRFRKLFRRSNN